MKMTQTDALNEESEIILHCSLCTVKSSVMLLVGWRCWSD